MTSLVGAYGLTAIGRALGETVYGDRGDDTLRGGAESDTITLEAVMGEVPAVVNLMSGTAKVEADTTVSLTSIENVLGSDYDGSITGTGLANLLDGGTGGGRFVFADVSWSRASAGIDQIIALSKAEDVIDLSLIDASPGGADSAFVFVGTGWQSMTW